MRQRSAHQPDLFLIVAPSESKLPPSDRPRILQLLGELIWSVVEPRRPEMVREETSDE